MSYHRHEQGSLSHGFSVQEPPVIKPEEVQALKRGEFVGRTTDEVQQYFLGRFKHHQFRKFYTIEPFVDFLHQKDDSPVEDKSLIINHHLDTIKSEVKSIVSCYKNLYDDAGTSLTSKQT